MAMNLCSKCVLPENFPTIRLDSEGVCNYCRAYFDDRDRDSDKNRYRQKFRELIREKAGRGGYDVIVAYSGGKDSTYTLDLLKRIYNLKVLALTFDNGFISQYALDNIRRVIENLGIDHIIFKPDFSMLRKIFVISVNQNPFSLKSLERASTICTSCMIFVKAAILKNAVEKSIPFVGYGWSPGQAPIQSSVMKMSPAFVKAAQNAACDALRSAVGELSGSYFLSEQDFEQPDRFPYSIHPLAFEPYDEDLIYGRIRELGWTPPGDTDPNSTNCIMNAYAIHVHKRQFQFHPYAFEISGLVRAGIMSRNEGLKRIYAPDDDGVIEAVRKRLFIDS